MNKAKERIGVFIEWRGRSLLLCEGIDELTKYEKEEIRLKAGSDTISIAGDELVMTYLTGDRIAIEGQIKVVSYV